MKTFGFPRRGGVLFEVMLSVALFGGAAAFTLAALRSVFASLQRVNAQQEAIDLAKSKMAELEAGLITLADLRGHEPDPHRRWRFDLKTRRTQFTGLTLIELGVVSIDQSERSSPAQFTLRQLVALRDSEGTGNDE